MTASSTKNTQKSTKRETQPLTRACNACRHRKMRCDVTSRHPPCTTCQLCDEPCFIPEDGRQWRRSRAATQYSRMDMKNSVGEMDEAISSVDAACCRLDDQTKREMPEESGQFPRQGTWYNSALIDANRLESSFGQQMEQLNLPQIGELLFSHFAMTPGEKTLLRSMVSLNMDAPEANHEWEPEFPSFDEPNLPLTDALKAAALPQEYPLELEHDLLQNMYAPTRNGLVPRFAASHTSEQSIQ